MSFVNAAPEALAAAAGNLARIELALSAANAAARTHTTAVLAAGADEVSTAIAAGIFRARPGVSGAQRAGGGRFMISLRRR